MKALTNELELDDSCATIFDSHCTPSHPMVAIKQDDDLRYPILSFEEVEKLYLWMKEKIKGETWCGCETIVKIQEEKNNAIT